MNADITAKSGMGLIGEVHIGVCLHHLFEFELLIQGFVVHRLLFKLNTLT